MSFAPGQSLDRYTIEALLGEGGMGTVYRAFDQRLQRHVALKVLRFPNDDDPAAAVSGALREARAAAAIAHPNVTAVYDAGELEGQAFIVQELVRGSTLRAVLHGDLPPLPTRIRWLSEIAAGLGAGHRVGVIHRDMKPENVIIRDDGRVKVLDFGIARRTRLAGGTDTYGTYGTYGGGTPSFVGIPRGTPAYMSPEQIRDEPVEGACDQFAWGVLAYELLSGQLPWKRAKDFLGYLGAVLTEEADPPSQLAPELPAALDALVLRALSKNAADRFGAMNEIVDILAHLLSGPAPKSPRPMALTPPEPVSTPTLLVRRAAPRPAPPMPSPAHTPTIRTSSAPPPQSPRPPALGAPPPVSSVPPPTSSAPSPVSSIPMPVSSVPSPVISTSPTPTTSPSLLVQAPASRRAPTPGRLHEPRFDAPVDLEAHLQLIPAGATCKGLFFHDQLRIGARAGLTHADLARAAGLPERRYQRFHDYPLSDLLRLLLATAQRAYPQLPVGEGLRRIGRGALDVVMETQIGRALLSALGRDLDGLLKRGPRVFKQMLSAGELVTQQVDFRTYVFHMRDLPLFLETYHVGSLEGVLGHCGAEGRILIQLDDLANGRIELRLN